MLEQLIVEQQFVRARALDSRRIALEEEARAANHGPALRTRVASALVRAGAWLDRGAIARARPVTRTPTAPPTMPSSTHARCAPSVLPAKSMFRRSFATFWNSRSVGELSIGT